MTARGVTHNPAVILAEGGNPVKKSIVFRFTRFSNPSEGKLEYDGGESNDR